MLVCVCACGVYLYKWCGVCMYMYVDVVCVFVQVVVCVCVFVHHAACVYLWKYVHGMCAVYRRVYVCVVHLCTCVVFTVYQETFVLNIIHVTVVLKNPDELNHLQTFISNFIQRRIQEFKKGGSFKRVRAKRAENFRVTTPTFAESRPF